MRRPRDTSLAQRIGSAWISRTERLRGGFLKKSGRTGHRLLHRHLHLCLVLRPTRTGRYPDRAEKVQHLHVGAVEARHVPARCGDGLFQIIRSQLLRDPPKNAVLQPQPLTRNALAAMCAGELSPGLAPNGRRRCCNWYCRCYRGPAGTGLSPGRPPSSLPGRATIVHTHAGVVSGYHSGLQFSPWPFSGCPIGAGGRPLRKTSERRDLWMVGEDSAGITGLIEVKQVVDCLRNLYYMFSLLAETFFVRIIQFDP